VLPQTVLLEPALAVTWSLRIIVVLLLLQTPEVTVHWKRLSPRLRPVTPDVAKVDVVNTELPDNTVQTPLPKLGAAPFRFALPVQLDRVLPAFETTLLFTTHRFAAKLQLLFFTVQVKMLPPWPRPLTLLVATFGWRMVAELNVLQLPVPTTGTVAPNWALLLHTSVLEPTCAADGLSFTMSTKSTAVQPALLTVHWKVLRPS
jgi:hypothetical protein